MNYLRKIRKSIKKAPEKAKLFAIFEKDWEIFVEINRENNRKLRKIKKIENAGMILVKSWPKLKRPKKMEEAQGGKK